MITAQIDTRYQDLYPKPRPIELEGEGGTWGVQSLVDAHVVAQDPRFLDYAWEQLYRKAADTIISITFGRDDYLVSRIRPLVDPYGAQSFRMITLGLRMELFFAQTERVIIPEMVYEPNTNKVIEWRCGYCGVPNKPDERTCVKCGAPRALLLQEL